ncbi:MAG TPA: ABC transporter permease [Stellaceae bacterium]
MSVAPLYPGRVKALALRPAAELRGTAAAIAEALDHLLRRRALCQELVRRDLTGQFANQLLGSFWVIAHPLSLLAIYVFVFAVVLKVKMHPGAGTPRDYTTYILSGLVPWLAMAQALARGSTALIAQSNLVKQVVFPIELLPMSATIIAFVPLVVSIPVIIGYEILAGQGLPITVLLLPLYLAGLFLFMSGIAFALAAATPFLRDLKDGVTVFITAGVYLIPAFWLPSWVPHAFAPLIMVNPFSYPIWVAQDILYFGGFAHPAAWAVFFAMALLSFAFGYRFFRRVKPYIANVL